MPRLFDGITDVIAVGNTNLPNAADFTVLALFDHSELNAWDTVFSLNSGDTTGWRVGFTIAGNLLAVTKQGVVDITSTVTVALNTTVACAWRCDENVGCDFFRKTYGDASATTDNVANTSAMIAGDNAFIGSRTLTGDVTDFNGEIGIVAVYDSLLSDALIEVYLNHLLYGGWAALNNANCRLLMPLHGRSTEVDLSGEGNNSISITGTTVVDHPTSHYLFGPAGWQGAFASAAPAAGYPAGYHDSARLMSNPSPM